MVWYDEKRIEDKAHVNLGENLATVKIKNAAFLHVLQLDTIQNVSRTRITQADWPFGAAAEVRDGKIGRSRFEF